jgi:hypothetical protein
MDASMGRVLWMGTTITDSDTSVGGVQTTVYASYNYGAVTYTQIRAFNETQIEGRLRFVSDNPVGSNQELTIWRCSLTPSGDTAMIGEDWSTLSFEGEILKDETQTASPYMNIVIS